MTFSNGINAPKENYGTGTKMISVMDILNPLPIKYDNILNSVAVDKKIEDKNKVEKGDLIFVRSSEIVEEVGWAKAYKEDRYALYSGFAIRGKRISSYNAYFIELTLNYANRKEVERRAGGSTRFNVSQEILNSLTVLTPLISEQNQIDLFFTKIDNTIALHQRKLDKLKRLKQGYLQQFFPKNDEKVPRVRFANFEEEWELRKVKEIFEVTRGQVLAVTKTSEEKSDMAPFPVYSSQTKNNGLMGYYKDYLFDTAITWTTDGANAGTVNYRNGKFYSTNVNGVLLSDKGYTNKAIAEIINLEAWKWVSHVGNPKLMNNVMGNISIVIPKSFKEQDRLSRFFKQIDNTITLHQSKLDKLKSIKQAFLQKMFIQ